MGSFSHFCLLRSLEMVLEFQTLSNYLKSFYTITFHSPTQILPFLEAPTPQVLSPSLVSFKSAYSSSFFVALVFSCYLLKSSCVTLESMAFNSLPTWLQILLISLTSVIIIQTAEIYIHGLPHNLLSFCITVLLLEC